MKNKLNKNILRYALKNKFSLAGLFVLFSICMSSLLTLGLLSNNFSSNYNKVVQNGNQHNIVINETYLSSTDGDKNKLELLSLLQSQDAINQDLNARRFEGLTVQVTAESQSKVIKYEPNYPVQQFDSDGNRIVKSVNSNLLPTDNLQVFIQTGLPYLEAKYLNVVQNFYYLPKSIDFEGIINYVESTYSTDLIGPISGLNEEQARILKARQSIVYFLAKSENSKNSFKNLLNAIISSNESTSVETVDPKSVTSTKTAFSQFFNKADANYNLPILIGSTINFQQVNNLIPDAVMKFEDYNSRICIVPPSLLRYQNKQVFSYTKFKNKINNSNNDSTSSIYNENSMNLSDFDEYFNSIDQKYKIKIDNLDYLIVGSGITPDFFYPIVSLENTVVDFNHESIVYTNNNGFERTLVSFQSAPLESLILIKYSGKQKLNNVINKLNVLAEKYLAFPTGTKNTFAANDTNNTFSPTAARVQFIEQLVSIVNALTVITSVILTLITLFIVIIILNKFISENKKSLYILIAQGISKSKAALSIILLPLFPCLVAAIFSYLFAFFMQSNVFSIFLNYWPLEIFTNDFNIFLMFGVFLGFYGLTSLVSYLITLRSLRGTVSSGLAINPSKLGPLAIAAKKPFAKFNVLTRFRVSLAFGSFTKLLFLIVSVFLFTITLTFISSTFTSFQTSLNTVLNTNKSTMQINLVSPTRNGGQYYGVSFDDAGKTLVASNSSVILNPPVFANKNNGYGAYYNNPTANNTQAFKEWASMMWISASDATRQKEELRYLSNVTNWEFLMNIGIAGNNPWTSIAAPLLPSNQRNTSNKFINELFIKLLSDNRIIKTSSDGISKKAFSTTYKTSINQLYLVNNNYEKDYMKIDSNIYPVIRVNNTNFSNLDKDNIKNDILSNYGDVFDDSTINIDSIVYDNNQPNILKVNLDKNVDILTSRKLFETFFQVQLLASANMSVFDEIDNVEREFSNNNPSGRIFNVLSNRMTAPFVNYVIYILSTPDYQQYLYKNIYNSSIVNESDEPYAYVDASFINPYTGQLFDSFNSNYKYQNSVDIIGIQQNSKFINLFNENNEKINDKLFNKKTTIIDNKEEYFPLIPNLYAKKLYNLNIGDRIKIFASNNVDRYNPNFINNNPSNLNNYYDEYIKAYTRTYEIVDFANSTKDVEFYTSMSSAQKTIGLSYIDENKNQVLPENIRENIIDLMYPNLVSNFSLINQYNDYGGFNGVFVNQDIIGVSNTLSLYSPSGLYPGSPELSSDVEITKTLIKNNLVKNSASNENTNWEILSSALYLTNDEIQQFKEYNQSIKSKTDNEINIYTDQIIDKLASIYRKTVFFATIDTPSSVQATVSTFLNLTDLINTIEIVIVSLVSFLSLIVLIVTAWIIIKDLTQLVVLLKVLGLSDWNNSLNMFAIFIPTWLISGIITLPILYLALEIFKEIVFITMGLIISPAISWLSFFIIFILVGGFLMMLLWLANRYIKKINLVESLKW